MSKFLKLCSCEFIKIIKKKSTKIMLILLVASLFLSAGITVLTKNMSNRLDDLVSNEEYRSQLMSEIEECKAEINSNGDNLDEISKNGFLSRIDTLQLAIDNNINIYKDSWKSELLLNELEPLYLDLYNSKSYRDEESETKIQENLNKYLECLKNDDFEGYVNTERDNNKVKFDNKEISENEYNDMIYILDLKQKYKIGKEYNKNDSWKMDILEELELLKNNERTGIDIYTQKALTEKTLEDCRNNIKIDEYRLEHNMPPYMSSADGGSMGSSRKIYDYMVGSFSILVLAVMMIIIAGGSISNEISRGTIKFWSFTPNKRWKILLSKLVVNTLILVGTTILISLLGSLVGRIFFGKGEAYLYVSNGSVHTINNVVFNILYELAASIDIFMFILLAMMLSTVTRNTATSVGVSIAAYLGGSTIMQILNMFVKADWLKFIPFNNLGIADRLFTTDMSYSASALVTSITGNIPVSFSLAVLGVTAIIMISTMFDSFRKKDIV